VVTGRAASAALTILICCAGHAWGQSAPAAAPAPPAVQSPTATPAWSFSASAYTYFLPDEGNYAQPTFTADHDALHLEARYNYEDLKTGSAWVGYNFEGGETVAWELTSMIGGVFGQTNGIAPGYKGSLSWRKLGLSSESEYVFDTGESSNSFLYNWSEATFTPVEWIRGGLVVQRTRAYHTERDVQRGLLVGVTYGKLDVTTYVFNPDKSKPVVVLAVTVNW
jgi:hypothetical protein